MLLDDDSDDEDDDDLDERKVTVPLTVTMIVIAGYIFGGTVLFGLWEGKFAPYLLSKNKAMTCDFQQCDILTCVDSYGPVQYPFKLRNFK